MLSPPASIMVLPPNSVQMVYGGGRPRNAVINIPLISVFAILIDGLGSGEVWEGRHMRREFWEDEVLCSSRKQNKYVFMK